MKSLPVKDSPHFWPKDQYPERTISVTLQSMRRAIAIQGCLALVAAFTMAPFQHVHHGHGADHDHDHSSFIHTHFYNTVAEVEHDDSTPEIEDPHDQHSASPLNTFTVVPSAVFALALPERVAIEIPAPSLLLQQLRWSRSAATTLPQPALPSLEPRLPDPSQHIPFVCLGIRPKAEL